METKKQILMSIYRNASSHLENEQEIITINESQLKSICDDLFLIVEKNK